MFTFKTSDKKANERLARTKIHMPPRIVDPTYWGSDAALLNPLNQLPEKSPVPQFLPLLGGSDNTDFYIDVDNLPKKTYRGTKFPIKLPFEQNEKNPNTFMGSMSTYSGIYERGMKGRQININKLDTPSYNSNYNSYSDVNLGNIQYYYTSDDNQALNADFLPLAKSKISFYMYTDPMGKQTPEYVIDGAFLADTRKAVYNKYLADTTYFRTSITQSQMNKNNIINNMRKMAPFITSSTPQTFTSNY